MKKQRRAHLTQRQSRDNNKLERAQSERNKFRTNTKLARAAKKKKKKKKVRASVEQTQNDRRGDQNQQRSTTETAHGCAGTAQRLRNDCTQLTQESKKKRKGGSTN